MKNILFFVFLTLIGFFQYSSQITIDQSAFICSNRQSGGRLAWAWFGGNGKDSNYEDNSQLLRPAPREDTATWQIGSKLYLLGGKNFTQDLYDFWVFDTLAYKWSMLSLNTSGDIGRRFSGSSGTNGTHLFIFGGTNLENGIATNTLYCTQAPEPNITQPIQWTLLHPSQAVLDTQNLPETPIDQLLPQASWIGNTDPSYSPGPRFGSGSWMLNDQLYLFGGILKYEAGDAMADLWRWDTRANVGWTLLPAGSILPNDAGDGVSFPSARVYPSTWVLGTYLYLFGGAVVFGKGQLFDTALNDLWRYDTLSGVWKVLVPSSSGQLPSTTQPLARSSAATFVSAGKLWLFGGSALGPLIYGLNLDDLYYFDVSISEWKTVISASVEQTVPFTSSGLGAPNDISAQTNSPGDRNSVAAFTLNSPTDPDPQFWIFGGTAWEIRTNYTFGREQNDIWAFKCYMSEPCGPNPFPLLVGECDGSQWIVPGAQNETSVQLNISIPVSLPGNITVSTVETKIVVLENAVNFTAVTSSGCVDIRFGNLTIDVRNYTGSEITLVTSPCITFNVSQVDLVGSDKCTKLSATTLRDSSRVYILIARKALCLQRNLLPIVVGSAVGGIVLVAAIASISLYQMHKRKWPRWLWHSDGVKKKNIWIEKRNSGQRDDHDMY